MSYTTDELLARLLLLEAQVGRQAQELAALKAWKDALEAHAAEVILTPKA